MGWVNWLKGLAGSDAAPAARPATRAAAAPRRGPRGGEAYAREWVKVLEEARPGERDPNATYTWELNAGEPPPVAAAPARPAGPAPKGRAGRADNVYDTYTWEIQETDDREDPWGLKRDEPPKPEPKRDGVNPYDTGIFDPGQWTGRFDQR